MNRLLCLVAFSSLILAAASAEAQYPRYVSGYYRPSSGTYVSPYYRTSPNAYDFDNYGYRPSTYQRDFSYRPYAAPTLPPVPSYRYYSRPYRPSYYGY